MGSISAHYSKLKETSEAMLSEDHPSGSFIAQMMKASVATNVAIQQAASLEEQLSEDHPHLNTVYRLLACLQSRPSAALLIVMIDAKEALNNKMELEGVVRISVRDWRDLII
jgi:hypothetical protein